MWTDTPEAELANRYFSRLESVFYNEENIDSAQDLRQLVRAPGSIYVNEYDLPETFLTADNVRSLLEAVIADCEAGTMTQTDGFHDGLVIDTGTTVCKGYYIDLNLVEQGLYFQIYADSENCLAWMEETGVLDYIAQRRNTYP
jgi:hypothetical protein